MKIVLQSVVSLCQSSLPDFTSHHHRVLCPPTRHPSVLGRPRAHLVLRVHVSESLVSTDSTKQWNIRLLWYCSKAWNLTFWWFFMLHSSGKQSPRLEDSGALIIQISLLLVPLYRLGSARPFIQPDSLFSPFPFDLPTFPSRFPLIVQISKMKKWKIWVFIAKGDEFQT